MPFKDEQLFYTQTGNEHRALKSTVTGYFYEVEILILQYVDILLTHTKSM